MTMEYFKEHSSEALKHLGEYEFLPLLCKLYNVENTNPHFTLVTFLNDPFSFYKKDLSHMYNDCKEGKYKYCALLLLVIFNNELEENHLTGKDPKVNEHIEDIREVCDIYEHITSRSLKTQLEILTGTFVTYEEGIYQTIHDKLFDFLAYYFGSQENLQYLLIRNANHRFILERFVVAYNTDNVHYSIPISDNKLQMYVKRVFDDMVTSSNVDIYIKENRNFMNAEFRNILLDLIKHLTKQKKSELIKTASSSFLSIIFVLKEEDITFNCDENVECFGIVIPDDLLQQYIEKLFEHLTKSDSILKLFYENRPLRTVSFRSAFRSYMRQHNAEQIAFHIETAQADFLNRMFVITEDRTTDYYGQPEKCFGIVIPDDLLQQYIERMFYHLTRSKCPISYMNDNRPSMSVTFRTALQSYMKKPETIASCIKIGTGQFLGTMFVMSDDDIKPSANNRHECFGIVLPDNLLERYIEKWFDYLTKADFISISHSMYENRLLSNRTFGTVFRSYIKQLNTVKIAYLIQTTTDDFINTMFVMTDNEIRQTSRNLNEHLCIVLPDSLLHQYIERLFNQFTKKPRDCIRQNRPIKNETFRTAMRSFMKQLKPEKIADLIENGHSSFLFTMCIMRDDDIKENALEEYHECFGFVIPDNLLHQFIERWFGFLVQDWYSVFFSYLRLLMNVTFRTSLRSYTKQLKRETIASLIRTGNDEFFKHMFVMTEEDIKENAQNLNECVGIVIPVDLYQQYIERWFDYFKTDAENWNNWLTRSHISGSFRNVLRSYMKQLKPELIAAIIEFGKTYFITTMFVMTEDDIKENAENHFDTIGIVIPDNLFKQYFARWFDGMIESHSIEEYLDDSRCLNDVAFERDLRTFIQKLTRKNIYSLILTTDWDFLNKMFVMTVEDIKINAENHYESFGIVIPDDMLQQYIERWFYGLTTLKAYSYYGSVKKNMNINRVLMNVKGQTAIQNYIKQINEDRIEKLIQKCGSSFLNTMFVMTEDDFKDNTENRHECFGIIIPENLLQQYIERWLNGLSDLCSWVDIKDYINANRSAMNGKFRVAFQNYIIQLSTGQIAFLIQSVNKDCVNSMFVTTAGNVKSVAVDQHNYFGIIIPSDLLQQYCERWFDGLRQTFSVKEYMDHSRCVHDVAFRMAMKNYIKQLTRVEILNLLQGATLNFVSSMFVMSEDDIEDNTENQWDCFGIVLPDDKIEKYIGRWFDGLTDGCSIKINIDVNRCCINVNFRRCLRNYIKKLSKAKIENLIQTGRKQFLNIIFVMAKDDIKDNTENRYECFGIVIPDELLHPYIGRWFDCITETDDSQFACPSDICFSLKEFIKDNRVLMNVTGRAAIQNYIRQIPKKTIEALIQRGGRAFLNTMCVTNEVNIKDNTDNLYEYIGVVIPDDLIQQYIERWFDDLTKTAFVREYMDLNRCVNDVAFRIALRIYIKQLTRRQIRNLHLTSSRDFFNTMFVMREDDIKHSAEHQCECFGIILPNDLLQKYIERLFDGLTKAHSVKKIIAANRCFKNDTFRIALQTYIKQLPRGKIGNLIQTGSRDFVNTMFVMTYVDIKENAENRLECLGIVIADDMLKQYCQRWFDSIKRTDSVKEDMNVNRLLMNVEGQSAMQKYIRQVNEYQTGTLILTGSTVFLNTMFVTTNDYIKDNAALNRYECFGIVLTDHLLQQYIGRLFDAMTKTDCVRKCFETNRCFLDVKFRITLKTYPKQQTRGKIRNLIQTGSIDFINTMFVMTEDEIKDNGEHQCECFGIIIPDDLLQQYIGRLFDGLTHANLVKKSIDANRCFKNVTFRIALQTYIKQLTRGKIGNLIQTGSRDFVNTMFVMTYVDIKENAENRLECLGIVIADDMLKQYCQRWFDSIKRTDSVKEDMNVNRLLMNVEGQAAMQNYIQQINEYQTGTIILTGSTVFLNTMFVTTNDYIRDNAVNRYECFGIVLTDHLLQQYIGRLFDAMTKTDCVRKLIEANRCFLDVKFRIALQTYINKLPRGKIENIIRTGSKDFVNTIFVITEGDMKEDFENLQECFGIILPDDFLHQYIERWFNGMTKTDSAKQYIDVNRTFKNCKFQASLDLFIRGIDAERIELLNRKSHIDYLNTRRDLLKENSTSEIKS